MNRAGQVDAHAVSWIWAAIHWIVVLAVAAAVVGGALAGTAHASTIRTETVRSCTSHLVRAIDYNRSERQVLRRDCSQLTRRDQRWALNDAAQVTS